MLRPFLAVLVSLAALGSSSAMAEWLYERKVDPFTDKFVSSQASGQAVADDQEYRIVFGCEASTGTPIFYLPVPDPYLSDLQVQFRVGKNPSHKSVWQQTSLRSRAFHMTFDDWQAVLKESTPSDELIVSPETTKSIFQGTQIILRFDMKGFRPAIDRVIADCQRKR